VTKISSLNPKILPKTLIPKVNNTAKIPPGLAMKAFLSPDQIKLPKINSPLKNIITTPKRQKTKLNFSSKPMKKFKNRKSLTFKVFICTGKIKIISLMSWKTVFKTFHKSLIHHLTLIRK
jgi:hypothetical protein